MRKLFVILLFFTLMLTGCKKKVDSTMMTGAHKEAVSDVYQKGLTYFGNGKYAMARRYFQLIIDNAPGSREFAKAKLRMADSYFFDLSGGTAEAIAEYQSYLVYFPSSEDAPYAQYMVGMCYYSQITSPDRDQSFSHKAIAEFEKLKNRFPDSPYAALGEKKIHACWRRLAEHELDVAIFYHKARTNLAAEGRFRYLLDNYLSYLSPEEREETYFNFARTLFELTKYDEAARYYRLLLKDFPKTLHHDQAKSDLAGIESGELQKEKKEKIEEFIKKIKKKRKEAGIPEKSKE